MPRSAQLELPLMLYVIKETLTHDDGLELDGPVHFALNYTQELAMDQISKNINASPHNAPAKDMPIPGEGHVSIHQPHISREFRLVGKVPFEKLDGLVEERQSVSISDAVDILGWAAAMVAVAAKAHEDGKITLEEYKAVERAADAILDFKGSPKEEKINLTKKKHGKRNQHRLPEDPAGDHPKGRRARPERV